MYVAVIDWSETLVDDKVDDLGVFGVVCARALPIRLEDGLGLPVATVNDVSHPLRVLKPPSIAVVAVEVQADVARSYAELRDLRVTLRSTIQLVQ